MKNQNELLTNEITQRYIEMINAGIAKYINKTGNNNLYGVFDDWAQICWVAILEYIYENEELPEDWWVWTKIHDVCVNNTIKGEKSNTVNYDELEHDHSSWGTDPQNLADYIEDKLNEEEREDFIDSLLDNFEEDSRERKFLEYFLEAAGLRDFGYHPPKTTDTGKAAKNNGYTDWYLAEYVLGIAAGQGASSFKTLKRRMLDFLNKKINAYSYLDTPTRKKMGVEI